MHLVSFFQRDKIKKQYILYWMKTKHHMQYQLNLLNSGWIINSKCSEMVKSCELVPVLTVAEEKEKRTSGNIRQTSFLPSCKDMLHIQVNVMLSKQDLTLTFCSCF